MDFATLKRLRLKQLLFLNVTYVLALSLIFALMSKVSFQISSYVCAGLILLLWAVQLPPQRPLFNRWFPFWQELLEYERSKMGPHWRKQTRRGLVMLPLGALFFVWIGSLGNKPPLHVESLTTTLFPATLGGLFVNNIVLLYQNRKVDRSTSETDISGHGWKSAGVAILTILAVLGIICLCVFLTLLWLLA